MNDTKVYLVHFDGYLGGSYGSLNYLLGIFTSKEKAEDAINKHLKKATELTEIADIEVPYIEEVILDHMYEISDDSYWDDYGTEIFLGGYVE